MIHHRLLIVCTATLVLNACTDGPAASPMPNRLTSAEEARLEQELRRSPELSALIAMREELTERARQRNVSAEMVREAYGSGDTDAAAALFGFTQAEAEALNHRLVQVQASLYRKHPVLRRIAVGEVEAPLCGIDIGARRLSTDGSETRNSSGGVLFSAEGDHEVLPDTGCKWIQYTAALALCSAAGPVLYWPCAYIAYCSFCDDDFSICY